MPLTHLEIKNLRILDNVSINPSNKLNVIFGTNGSGKTSLLEAIHFLSLGRSFRTRRSHQLIKHDNEEFIIFGTIQSNEERRVKIGIRISGKSKQIKKDGVEIRSATEVVRDLPMMVINPDIHKLIEEGPKYRRQFLDWGVFHVEQNFPFQWKKYSQVLRQRNASLRERLPRQEVIIWDQDLVEAAKKIDEWRKTYLEDFNPIILDLLKDQKNLKDLHIKFYSGWKEKEDFAEVINRSWETDKETGFTNYGPHKADLKFNIDSHIAKQVASRGQQKVLASLLKLAQIRLMEKTNAAKATIMFDDLPAELDEDFRQQLLHLFLDTDAQLFFTTVDKKLLNGLVKNNEGKMFHVKQGDIEEVV
jgi:DNA replication and repair protein RecF